MAGHLDTFVREGREEIRKLNDALLALEADPDDTATIDDVFRSAHTLKGNSSAMGFEDAAELAHAVEDMLDEMREDRLEVTPDRMDLIFEGVDQLEAMLDEIEDDQETTVDPTPTVERIRSSIEAGLESVDEDGDEDGSGDEDGDEDGSGDEDGNEDGSGDGDETETAFDWVDVPDATGTATLATVEMEESTLPGADGMLVVQRASERHDLLGATPSAEAIEDGEYDGGFELVLAGDPEAVRSTLEGLQPVEGVSVRDATDLDRDGADPAASSGDDGGGSDAEGEASGRSDDGDPDGPSGDGAEPTGEGVDAGGDPEEGSGGSDGGGSGGPDVGGVSSVKVDVDRLDDLYGSVQQLVTGRVKLRRVLSEAGLDPDEHLDELDKATASLQNTVMDMRLVSMESVVGRFPRVVRDIARDQGKQVEFEMEGTDVELDRTILDRLSDPLVHVVRNAVDHGIEPPEERERAGKPPTGTVRLTARRKGDRVTVTVEDDGAGLDADEIRGKAREEGVRSPAELESMSDDDVYDLIFHPGFSTAEEVTDVSGRGVGMDVVHETVARLDGDVDVDSDPGEGTTVTLDLPVSIAIVRVLFLVVDGHEYGIPLKKVDRISKYRGTQNVNGEEMIEHEGDLYPVIRLEDALDAVDDRQEDHAVARDGGETADGDDGMLVRIRPDERAVALHCDAVTDHAEVVVKPLEGVLSGTAGISGTAVVGEGDVVPILDPTMI